MLGDEALIIGEKPPSAVQVELEFTPPFTPPRSWLKLLLWVDVATTYWSGLFWLIEMDLVFRKATTSEKGTRKLT